jgi:hypothetical protein
MRGRRKGDTKIAKALRQEQVYRLLLRGVTVDQTARLLQVSRRTIETDYREIQGALLEHIEASHLYSLRMAFAELDEIWRELWRLFDRPPTGEKDDSMVKIAILRDLFHITITRAKLCGLLSPKFADYMAMQQISPPPTGVRIIRRQTFEEEMEFGVEQLKKNKELARRRGIQESDLL